MPRMKMQRSITTTTVHGFTIEEGQPKAASIVLPGKKDLAKAVKEVRKNDPSFSGTEVTTQDIMYTMDVSRFIELADKTEITEDKGEN